MRGIDVFTIVGIGLSIPVLGCIILIGIIVSRGVNFVNHLFKKYKEVNKNVRN